jgi:hypothetical protein
MSLALLAVPVAHLQPGHVDDPETLAAVAIVVLAVVFLSFAFRLRRRA